MRRVYTDDFDYYYLGHEDYDNRPDGYFDSPWYDDQDDVRQMMEELRNGSYADLDFDS